MILMILQKFLWIFTFIYELPKEKENKKMFDIYLIQEDVEDWPENDGGTYLKAIFANKEDADKERERLNKNRPSKKVSYFVDKGVVR